MILIYIFGCFFLLHGGGEITKLVWSQISFEKYTDPPDIGKTYVQLDISSDNIYNTLSLKSAKINNDSRAIKVREN